MGRRTLQELKCCINPSTGQSVVQDTVTKEIIHFGGPGFKY